MKRMKKVSMFLMIVLLSTSYLLNVFQVDGIEWVWYDNPTELTSDLFQTRAFYSNYTNRFYSFFNEHAADQSQGVYYSTSFDGVNWLGRERLDMWGGAKFAFYWGRYLSRLVDFYLEPNGRYLHHVFGWSQAGAKYLTYQRYELFLNGTMKSQDYYEFTYAPFLLDSVHEVSICADSEGYPYISVVEYQVAGQLHYAQLLKCDQNNGTWLSHTKYREDDVGIPANADYYKKVKVMPLENQGIHWFIAYSPSQVPIQELKISFVNYWDGTGWHSSFAEDDAEGGDWADERWCLGWYGNLTVLFSQDELGATDIRLTAQFRDGKNNWENKTIVSFEVAGDAGSTKFMPLVSVGENFSISYIWGITGNETLWYRQSILNASTGDHEFLSNWVDWQDCGFNLVQYEFASFGSLYSPMVVELQEDNTPDWIWYDYLGEDFIPSLGHLNTTLTSGITFDDWVFMGETYYFTSYIMGADTFKLYFNDGYDIHTVNFNFINSSLIFSTDNDEDDEFITGLFYSDYELIGDVQKLVWGWIPEKNIVDDLDVTVSYELYNEATNTTLTGSTGILFNLYNLGGFGDYQHTDRGRTGRKEAGDQYEIWNYGFFAAGVSDEINATGIWRRLQHIHTTFSFYRQRSYVGGYYPSILSDDDRIYFGIDYYENGTWINVLEVRITVEDAGLVGRGGINVDSSYDVFNVTWWTQGIMEKQDIITVYNHGYSFYGDEPNNRTYNRLWLDLWFNKLNSSTVVGGRVAPYYNGMWEWNGNPFWFGYGDFQPFWYNNSATSSLYYTELKNSTGNVRSCYGLEIMRFYDGIRKTDDFLGYLWQIQDFQIFDVNLADDRMEGIDTPVFVESEDISMPKGGGFLQPLVNAINGISTMFTKAIFNATKLIMGSIGLFMDMIGLGDWWLSFSTILFDISDFSMNLMAQLQIALLNSAILLNQIFILVYNGFGRFTFGLTTAITSLIEWYTYIAQMFTGGGIFNINIWAGLAMGDFLLLGMHLLPVFWVQRLAKADDLIRTIQGDLSFAITLVTGLFNFLVMIIMLSIALINFLIGLLPI